MQKSEHQMKQNKCIHIVFRIIPESLSRLLLAADAFFVLLLNIWERLSCVVTFDLLPCRGCLMKTLFLEEHGKVRLDRCGVGGACPDHYRK